MAATAALIAVSAGSMIFQNQVSQKQKGLQGKMSATAPELPAPPTPKAPSSKPKPGATGRSTTLLTGPMGVTDPAPVARKTLLGL